MSFLFPTAPATGPLTGAGGGPGGIRPGARAVCRHCGTPCGPAPEADRFCCTGCRLVFELLHAQGLGEFYALQDGPGHPAGPLEATAAYAHLDEPAVRDRLVDYADDRQFRVTFRVPSIHCVACVWLLENLHRLHPGIGSCRVHFTRRELAVTADTGRIRLGELAGLLARLGYPPELSLADLDRAPAPPAPQRLWLRIAVAGFAFGNTMLFSLPHYFGLDSASGPAFRTLVGWLSLLLAIPVVGFSAQDYFRSALNSARVRRMTMDVPIALGIAALWVQSAWEVASGRGAGYFDSLAGLVFFLLCGRLFQQKTYDRLAFDRDYTAFFPLSVTRLEPGPDPATVETRVALALVGVGDRLRVRCGELVPADVRLLRGAGLLDYSFVTGESAPVCREPGELLFAGGRQVGGAIEVEITKPVSQSYLASLWDSEAFRKDRDDAFNTLTNRYSRRFTWIVLGLAVGAAEFWAVREPARAVRAFTGILIVACPCALALAAPFTLGTALRLLGRRRVFLRNAGVLESLARVDTVVFDKTGTLTAPGTGDVAFLGKPLRPDEAREIAGLAGQSSHPLSRRIGAWLAAAFPPQAASATAFADVSGFMEVPGLGVAGRCGGRSLRLGSPGWVAAGAGGRPDGSAPGDTGERGSVVQISVDGRWRGTFVLSGALRPEAGRLLQGLSRDYRTALLSGDQDRDRARLAPLFGPDAPLHFQQSPGEKLAHIRGLQAEGRTVMMVGDGLNDAGALRQSDVGVAVVEETGAFCPASDVIVDASQVVRLHAVLRYARHTVGVVRFGFLLSGAYNVLGLAIAASGNLSPVVCAILMPLSSVTVVAVAVGAAHWLERRAGLEGRATAAPSPADRAQALP
ncbi:MAG: heavy metal translocating P-type ATPase metal-binding domain-containing protein [Verrucomicrobia bacterium]|nr:heavy metal translocating P-type ATPase metal-binding domain-containing protein [Verrucomicrobiota bacterium]